MRTNPANVIFCNVMVFGLVSGCGGGNDAETIDAPASRPGTKLNAEAARPNVETAPESKAAPDIVLKATISDSDRAVEYIVDYLTIEMATKDALTSENRLTSWALDSLAASDYPFQHRFARGVSSAWSLSLKDAASVKLSTDMQRSSATIAGIKLNIYADSPELARVTIENKLQNLRINGKPEFRNSSEDAERRANDAVDAAQARRIAELALLLNGEPLAKLEAGRAAMRKVLQQEMVNRPDFVKEFAAFRAGSSADLEASRKRVYELIQTPAPGALP